MPDGYASPDDRSSKKSWDEINRQTDEARAKIAEVLSKIYSLRLLENEASAAVEALKEIDQRLLPLHRVWIPRSAYEAFFQQFKLPHTLCAWLPLRRSPEMPAFSGLLSVGSHCPPRSDHLDKADFLPQRTGKETIPFFRVVDLSILPNL
jgi:hypothetical protein